MTEAELQSHVRREGNRVWIEGVPALGWGKARECTFAGALEAAFAVTEHPVRYSDLMGLSGLAFRIRWYQGKTGQQWCPSSPVGEFPEEIEAVQRNTGWRFRVESMMDQEENPPVAKFASDIVASIDAGRPVVVYPALNCGVAFGYENGGESFLLYDYVQGASAVSSAPSALGPMLIFLRSYAEPPARRQAVLDALGMAVRNWHRGPMPSEKGDYWYGKAGLARWIEDLGTVEDLNDEQKQNLFFVSWWNFDSLADARFAAGVFLAETAGLFGGEAREALARAAAVCQEESDDLGAVFGKRDAFLGPWTGKTIADWSPEVRKREREVLTQVLERDSAAMAELEKALAAEGIDVTSLKAAPSEGTQPPEGDQ